MKNTKIIIATHKKYKMPNDKMYVPVQVGKEGKEDLGYQPDNEGDNISSKNPKFPVPRLFFSRPDKTKYSRLLTSLIFLIISLLL